MSTYHNPSDAVAAADPLTNPGATPATNRPDREAIQHEAFIRDVRSVARQLYFSCPDASADDKMFLQDVARARYGFKALERLIRIGRASRRAEHRAAVITLAERWSNPTGELPPTVYTAFAHEYEAQVNADRAQREFELSPSPTNRERVMEFLSNQVAATRRAILAVRSAPVR